MGVGPGALAAYRASHDIFKALAARGPRNTEWQRDVFICHARLGLMARDAQDRAGARREFEAGRAIMRRLVALDPSNAQWKKDLAWIEAQIAALGP